MKKIIISFMLAMVVLSACKKVEDQYPSKVKTVSAPTITLNGDPVVILNVGDTYVDQGATYYDSLYGDNGTLSTSTEVNTSEEGFYIVTYSAVNQFGFEGSGTRLVAVTGASDLLDVSGDYVRAATGGEAAVTKIGRGVFYSDNVGGLAAINGVYFMFTSDSTMIMPYQFLANYGVFADFVDPVYDFQSSPPNYSYKIDAAGFGTGIRIFDKQP